MGCQQSARMTRYGVTIRTADAFLRRYELFVRRRPAFLETLILKLLLMGTAPDRRAFSLTLAETCQCDRIAASLMVRRAVSDAAWLPNAELLALVTRLRCVVAIKRDNAKKRAHLQFLRAFAQIVDSESGWCVCTRAHTHRARSDVRWPHVSGFATRASRPF